MKKNFPDNYQKFKIIDAVDAEIESNLNVVSIYDNTCDYDLRSPLTMGEKCCAISHIKALEEFVQTGDDFCIIIEDDLIGEDLDFNSAIKLLEITPPSSLIILGGQQGLKNSSYLSGYNSHKKQAWRIPRISQYFLTRACCYALGRDAAIHILAKQKGCLTRADNWLFHCASSIKIFYADIFKHPLDLANSSLERDRKTDSFIQRVNRDGIDLLFLRSVIKILILASVKFGCLKRVSIKSF